jgi:hypothetical protein
MPSVEEFNKWLLGEIQEQIELSNGILSDELLEWLELRIKDLRAGPQQS